MELTTKSYWQDYYFSASEDKHIIDKVCGRYDRFYQLLMNACAQPPKSILEIGAFPGRYLAYLGKKYDLKATGLDFNPDAEKFSRSMRAMDIHKYEYICADFLKH